MNNTVNKKVIIKSSVPKTLADIFKCSIKKFHVSKIKWELKNNNEFDFITDYSFDVEFTLETSYSPQSGIYMLNLGEEIKEIASHSIDPMAKKIYLESLTRSYEDGYGLTYKLICHISDPTFYFKRGKTSRVMQNKREIYL